MRNVMTPPTPVEQLRKARESSLYTLIVSSYIAAIVISISISQKFVMVGPWAISGGVLVWPITFIFNDIFTEVYGYSRSRQIIWTGMAAELFTALLYWLVSALPSAPFWHGQEAFQAILGQAPRVVAASLLAYFWGEYTNSVMLSKLKYLQHGAGGWAQSWRFVASTVAGELVDTAIFFPVAFLGVIPVKDLLGTMAFVYIAKVVYEIVALPASMRLTDYIKRRENVNVIDDPTITDYSPAMSL